MNNLLDDLILRYPALTDCKTSIHSAFLMLSSCLKSGGKLLLCGNGGSAADAEHWAGELLKGFVSQRKLPKNDQLKLPPLLGDKLQWGIPAIPITGFSAFNTAYGNDVDFDLGFAQLVWTLACPGDVLVAISTSGNSRNVCFAAQAAKAKNAKVLVLTGITSGSLGGNADVCINVPQKETFLIQELHLPIYHSLSLMLEIALDPNKTDER